MELITAKTNYGEKRFISTVIIHGMTYFLVSIG